MTHKNQTSPAFNQQLPYPKDPEALLTTNQVADHIGVKPKTIRRYVSRKLLNYILIGNRLRFRPSAVELFLAQREVRG